MRSRLFILVSCLLTHVLCAQNGTWEVLHCGNTGSSGLVDNVVNDLLVDSKERLWATTPMGISMLEDGNWTTFDPYSGVAAYSVFDVLEDPEGNLWFATSRGVSKFDGVDWQTFGREDGFPASYVVDLAVEPDGDLWCGSAGLGVWHFDGNTVTAYTTDDGLLADRTSDILVDEAGIVWVSSDKGLSRFDGQSWTGFTKANSNLFSDALLCLGEDEQGRLWVGMQFGVNVFDGTGWTYYNIEDGLINNWVYDIEPASDGSMWFACKLGVSQFKDGVWQSEELGVPNDVWINTGYRALAEGTDGAIWIGSDFEGLWRFDGTIRERFNTDDGLADNHITSILVDREGQQWIGSWGNGLSKRDRSGDWTTFNSPSNLSDRFVYDLLEHPDGSIWVATNNRMRILRNETWETLEIPHAGSYQTTYSVYRDSRGRMWFGSPFGASCLDGDSWTHYTEAQGLAGAQVYEVIEDRNGDFWFVTDGGLSRYNGTLWTNYLKDNLPSAWVHTVFEDAQGVIWLGTSEGVGRIVDGEVEMAIQGSLPALFPVRTIVEDNRGDLWFGTYGTGLIQLRGDWFESGNWSFFTRNTNGFQDDRVLASAKDQFGVLHFGTRYGGMMTYTDPGSLIFPKTLTVFPNPTSDFAYIRYANESSIQLDLFDLHGRHLRQWTFPETAFETEAPIPLTGLASGLYLLQTTVDGEAAIQRLVID